MNNKNSAGFISLLIAIMTIIIWYIFFTFGNPHDTTLIDNLNYLLNDKNEMKPWFIASIFSGVFSCIAACIYFYKKENTKLLFMVLFIICTLQAVPAIWFLSWDLKAVYILPVIYGYLAYKNPNKVLKWDAKQRAPLN